MSDLVSLDIAALGQRGEGVAEHLGQRVYVPLVLPGERIGATIFGERGTLVELLTPSPDRAEPFCPYFGTCGGCQLQHLAPVLYAGFKRDLVTTALSHAGVEAEVAPLIDARGIGRRRATFHVRQGVAGYMGLRSHDLVAIDRCPILVPALAKSTTIARAIGKLIGDCEVSLTATLTGLDIAVRTEKKLKPERLAVLGQSVRFARLALNGVMIFQAAPPEIAIGKIRVDLPVNSFLQATQAAEDILADLVLAGVGKAKHIADLFCGLGPFALRLAQSHRLYAADSDRPAIAALDKAFRMTQGLKAATVVRRDLFRDPLAPVELAPFDAMVLDPPRAGAEAQAREIALSKVPTVVYVSCEPKTFARDARILVDAGFRLDSVTPVDQFAYSTHVEVVGIFRR